ncbi:MAG: hypothetical protein KDJ83_11540 [Rhodobacteraceae bacterium]|nr:hypothetical protein [Paracoccaceae bacterium]
MMNVQHIELYTPAETAELTGIGVVLQRDHRRRFPEWMPPGAGHARFNLLQCLQMSFVAEAAEFEIGPGKAYAAGEWVAHSALQFALKEPGCIAGDLASDVTMPGASDDDIRDFTARRIFSEAFGRPNIVAPEFVFLWGDGTDWFGPSLEACLGALPEGDPRRGKPFLSLHLPSFARRMVAKLPRPAVRILQCEGA